MHDIVKTLQDGPESVAEILWSEGPWLGEELEKAWEKHYEVQGYSPFAFYSRLPGARRGFAMLTTAPGARWHLPK